MSPKQGTRFERIISGGQITLTDLSAQILNLVVSLNDEKQSLGENQGKEQAPVRGNIITARALGMSIIMLQFSAIEALVNFIARVTCEIDEQVEGAPRKKRALSNDEVGCLKEKKAWVSTLKKTQCYPQLLAKLFEHEFSLDKSGEGWQKLDHLKKTRDRLVHFRIADHSVHLKLDLNNVPPALPIIDQDLFGGSEALYWYAGKVLSLVSALEIAKLDRLIMVLRNVQHLAWMCLAALRESGNMSEKQFEKKYPLPIG